MAGFASYEGRTYELLPANDGRHVLFEVDPVRLPQGNDEFQTNHKDFMRSAVAGADLLADTTSGSTTATVTSTSTAISGSVVVHDVLL